MVLNYIAISVTPDDVIDIILLVKYNLELFRVQKLEKKIVK